MADFFPLDSVEYGIFSAIVEDTEDPRSLNRIRIRIPRYHGTGVNDGLSTDQLPWAYLGDNYPLNNTQPPVGSLVKVTREVGSSDWIVLSKLYDSSDRSKRKLVLADNGNNVIYIEADADALTVDIVVSSGGAQLSRIRLSNGDVKLDASGNMYLQPAGQLHENPGGSEL